MVQASMLGPNKNKRGRLRYLGMVQASSLGPNKHKRGRLRYLRGL